MYIFLEANSHFNVAVLWKRFLIDVLISFRAFDVCTFVRVRCILYLFCLLTILNKRKSRDREWQSEKGADSFNEYKYKKWFPYFHVLCLKMPSSITKITLVVLFTCKVGCWPICGKFVRKPQIFFSSLSKVECNYLIVFLNVFACDRNRWCLLASLEFLGNCFVACSCVPGSWVILF